MKRVLTVVLGAALAALVLAAPSQAAFGVKGFSVTFSDEAGGIVTQPGAHPFAMNTSFAMESREEGGGLFLEGALKDIIVKTPLGFAGNPTATPRCSGAEFAAIDRGKSLPACPNSSAVGLLALRFIAKPGENPPEEIVVPIYNLTPAPGQVLKLGFVVDNVPVTLEAGLSDHAPYRVVAPSTNISQVLGVVGVSLTLWGNPLDPVHDPYRGNCVDPLTPIHAVPGEPVSIGNCPVSVPEKPFLTLPRSCHGPLVSEYAADAWQNPGARLENGEAVLSDPAWVSGSAGSHGLTGCAGLAFDSSIASQPTTTTGDSPSGLNFDLDVNDPGLRDPDGIAGSDIERAVVTLPDGFTTNSAVASGLSACTLAQYEAAGRRGRGCPQASKVGSVEVETPLLEEEGQEGVLHVLHGSIYVAKQHDNVFDNLLTIYMVIRDPQLGIFIKLPGKVEPNPKTGRITTTFSELPEFPFSHFHLHFHEGSRAPLITPATCGQFNTKAVLYPYANPSAPVERTATFTIGSGAAGSCASSLSQLPFSPDFTAGTLTPTAGAYSPFVLRLSRRDGTQRFSSVSTKLPQGLLGRIAGIPYCPESAIAQAQSRSAEGMGALEGASPSCPAVSELGSVEVGAGAGPEPYYVAGHAYLAGPYKGAPLSLEIVTPAIAGPFDLGTVAVRTALQIDPETAEITAVSDPIPNILFGLPLDVRSIAISMDRPGFTLNPTDCEPSAVVGSVTSTTGGVAHVGDRFQVGGCRALKFKPRVKLRLKGATKRTGHPALKAVVTYPKKGAYANISRAQVNLPHSEFLDQGNLNKTCTKPVLLAGKCPKTSVYGHAKAWTPLLEKPLKGPVYLVGGYGYKLPALVAELNGQIRVLLKGKVDSGPNKGIRSTFEAVPDAPVSRFVLEMKGGKKYGLLENSENLCKLKKANRRAIAHFTGQNNKVDHYKPLVTNQCGKKKSRARKRHGHTTSKKAHLRRHHR